MTPAPKCMSVFSFALACSVAVLIFGCGGGSHRRQAEERAESAFNVARGNPLTLRAFLVDMPKGAELHYHLEGGVYAESWIRAGAEDHLCVNLATTSFVPKQGANCAAGNVPAENALHDQQLYDKLLDAFSMRGFVPTPGVTGHDQFFNTFGRFQAADAGHAGDWSTRRRRARLRRTNSIWNSW